MPQRKHIRVTCNGTIAVDPSYESPWEDIWLRWKDQPGRVRKTMVTICGRGNLERDIDIDQKCLDKGFDKDIAQELVEYRDLLSKLTTPESIAVYPCDDGYPDIYIGKPVFTRADAERVMAWWLAEKHGVRSAKYCWRRPRYMVVSV